MDTKTLPNEIRELYSLWVRLCKVLDESVDRVNSVSTEFPKDVAHAKTFATEVYTIRSASDDLDTSISIINENSERLDSAMESMEQIVNKVTATIHATLDAIELLNAPSSMGAIHTLGTKFSSLQLYDPVAILVHHNDFIRQVLPLQTQTITM
jgi:methyl-accepting chemotaxis protein